MLLLVVNYPEEIDLHYRSNQPEVDVHVLKEQKGSLFALKTLKLLQQKKYTTVVHYGLCGAQHEAQLGKLFHITQTFLRHDQIIENQKYAKRACIWTSLNLEQQSIVTKFRVGTHTKDLYEFAPLYDLESFRVAQMSCVVAQQVITIKGASDLNDISCVQEMSEEEDIDFLLHPERKRTKKQLLLAALGERIDALNNALHIWRETTGKKTFC